MSPHPQPVLEPEWDPEEPPSALEPGPVSSLRQAGRQGCAPGEVWVGSGPYSPWVPGGRAWGAVQTRCPGHGVRAHGVGPAPLVSRPPRLAMALTRHSGEGSVSLACPRGGQRGPAGRGATGTARRVRRPLREQTPLRWLLRRDTVQAPGRPGSRARRCYCCSVFGTGPSAPLLPPTPHMWEPQACEHFPLSSAETHPEGRGPAKGRSITEGLFSLPRTRR